MRSARHIDIWISTVTVTFTASVISDDQAGFTYKWIDDSNYSDILSTANTLTVTVKSKKNYICRVYDRYGNVKELYYSIEINN